MIDDLAIIDPGTPRGLEVRGTGELHDTGGAEKFGDGWGKPWIRIVDERIVSWVSRGTLSPRRAAQSPHHSPELTEPPQIAR